MREKKLLSDITVPSDADFDCILKAANLGKGVVFVSDCDGAIQGMITDGDIRRALVTSPNSSQNAASIAQSSFFWLSASRSETEVRQALYQSGHQAAPLLDDKKRLVDVFYLRDLINRTKLPNRVILMAGGRGVRMGEITKTLPKPMVKVGDKPMIEHLVHSFKFLGFQKFTISVNYLKEQIIEHFEDGSRFGVEIDYIEETAPLGTAGSLSLLTQDLGHPAIVMNADVLTKIDFFSLIEFHNANKSFMTLAVKRDEYEIPFGVVSVEGMQVAMIEEKPTHQYFVNSGIYVIDPSLISRLEVGVRCDMPELIQRLISQNEKVLAYPVVEYWKDVGNVESLSEARQDW